MRPKKLSHLLGPHIQKEGGTDDMARTWGQGQGSLLDRREWGVAGEAEV